MRVVSPDEDITVGGFSEPDFDDISKELALIDASEEKTRQIAHDLFFAENPAVDQRYLIDRLVLQLEETDKRRRDLTSSYFQSDAVETVVSNEKVAKPHWFKRAVGVFTGVLGVALVLPMPLIVGAGVEESLLIERVVEDPVWGLAYGFAPFAGVIATHGIRDALQSARLRRWFDISVYLGTVAVFAAWASAFGPTFLTDVLTDPLATSGSLADFYGYHLTLEIFGAASAYAAATQLLTSGKRQIAKPSQAREVIAAQLEDEDQRAERLARDLDVLEAQPQAYENALRGFQQRCIAKVAAAKAVFASESAVQKLRSYAAIQKTSSASIKENYHA